MKFTFTCSGKDIVYVCSRLCNLSSSCLHFNNSFGHLKIFIPFLRAMFSASTIRVTDHGVRAQMLLGSQIMVWGLLGSLFLPCPTLPIVLALIAVGFRSFHSNLVFLSRSRLQIVYTSCEDIQHEVTMPSTSWQPLRALPKKHLHHLFFKLKVGWGWEQYNFSL